MKRLLLIMLIIALEGAFIFPVLAQETFPKIANYYLDPIISSDSSSDLSKYDLLILDIDTQTANQNIFSAIKKKNPEVKFLAYLPSAQLNVKDMDWWAKIRREIKNRVDQENWWLRDKNGHQVSLSEIWSNIYFINPNDDWNNYLSDLVGENISENVFWDGVFYDMVFKNISWLNGGDININNYYWQEQTKDLLKKTKEEINGLYLIANLDFPDIYQSYLNGIMMENFPTELNGKNNWSYLMNQYLNHLPEENLLPQIQIINANTDNRNKMDSYREMRFGLASTLLGNGYYSFDSGDQNHAQTWWYDEYDNYLGKSISSSINLLNPGNNEIKPGFWRRDFEQGIVLVNSTEKQQKYFFNNEEFEKINGSQDRRINNGSKINFVQINSKDGLVLLKKNKEIKNDQFENGSFIRIFNPNGKQIRNGFFSFKEEYPGREKILITDLNIITQKEGKVFYNNAFKFTAYNNFKGDISLATDKEKVLIGPGYGGGPHVKLFNNTGNLITEFMAYDERFRGGIDVAFGDINGDKINEIITSAGFSGGPHIKIFSQEGVLINEFMAYDERFRGGVSISCGDIDGDNKDEIITGPGPSGGPHVRVFNQNGLVLNEFMAYDESYRDGIMVMTDNIADDDKEEILIGIINF